MPWVVPAFVSAANSLRIAGPATIAIRHDQQVVAPRVYYNGVQLATNVNYVWSSSDPSLLSVDSTNRNFVGHAAGNVTMTVSYNSETAAVDYNIKFSTQLSPVNIEGIQLLPGINPSIGFTSAVSVDGLYVYPDGTPISNATVNFYGYEGSNNTKVFLCSAVTAANGSASCSVNKLTYYRIAVAYYDGDETHMPTTRANSD